MFSFRNGEVLLKKNLLYCWKWQSSQFCNNKLFSLLNFQKSLSFHSVESTLPRVHLNLAMGGETECFSSSNNLTELFIYPSIYKIIWYNLYQIITFLHLNFRLRDPKIISQRYEAGRSFQIMILSQIKYTVKINFS